MREGQFFADGFAVRRYFFVEEGERKLISYLTTGGCGCGYLTVEGGEVVIEGEGFLCIRRGEDRELRPRPYPAMPETVRLRTEEGGENYLVECRTHPASICVTGSAELQVNAKVPFFAPSIRRIEGQREALAEINARCADGQYLAIIALAKGRARLLLEEVGDILCRGNEVTVKRCFDDLCGREATTRYVWRGSDFDLSREFTRTHAISFRREEMGRALLEAVIAKDDDALGELLSPEIATSQIYDYFGEVLSVETPYSPAPPTAVDAILRSEGQTVSVTFDFDFDISGRIENVRRLEDE